MKRLLTAIAVLAVVATPALAQPANPDAIVKHRGNTLIDSQGWRFHNGEWDNTCFRTLDYLSSMSSCSGGAGG